MPVGDIFLSGMNRRLGMFQSPIANEDRNSAPSDARLRFAPCHGPEHFQHGWDRAFYHDSAIDGLDGRPAIVAGLADRCAHRNFRRFDMERTGGGAAGFWWQLPFSSRGLRPSQLGSPDGLSFYLAIRSEWPFGNRIRDGRIRKLFHLSLAGIERSRPAIRGRGHRACRFVPPVPADDIPA